MNVGNAAAITLWILILIIIIIVIVWIACECSKKNKTVNVVAVEPSRTAASSQPHQPQQQQQHQYAYASAPKNKWESLEKPFAESANAAGDMMPYEPYGAEDPSSTQAPAHGANFPIEEDPAARFPTNPPAPGNALGPDSVCSPAGISKSGFNLDVNHLMPASWRGGLRGGCGDEAEDTAQWAAYAPSKEAFDSYITTAGSARLSVNTRTPHARQIGLPNLVKDAVQGCGAGGAPIPIGSNAVIFNDSDLRQNAIYNSTGSFPNIQDTWC